MCALLSLPRRSARSSQFLVSVAGRWRGHRSSEHAGTSGKRGTKRTVVPLCYRRCVAIRKKRSISIPPELDAEIAAAAKAAGMSYSAWVAQTARKEFTIRAGLEAAGQYEAEHGAFTPAEIAEADEWATSVIRPAASRRSA
jgi:hypothetical protein